MHVPVCIRCAVEMKIDSTGVKLEEMANKDQPYKIWFADVFSCPGCGFQVAAQFADRPHAEHFQPDYSKSAIGAVKFWPRLYT